MRGRGYEFVTPTPASHARVIARPGRQGAHDLRDALGWSLPFAPGALDQEVESLLARADMLDPLGGGLVKARVRVSSLHGQLFLHSAFPTDARDSIFFGPDSYRFADLIAAELSASPLPPGSHIVDMGAGAGVGGIAAALASRDACITLTDLNPHAIRFARINARAAGVPVDTVTGDTLVGVADPIDFAIINPPYIVDDSARAYRHGGGMHGGEVPLAMTRIAADRIAPGGRLILYSGAAIVAGRNSLCEAVINLAAERGLRCACRETDPDVFGEELSKPAYADVERIALIAATLTRPA